jgi:hypothetical protein
MLKSMAQIGYEFSAFVAAVISNWAVLATGGVLVLLVQLWKLYNKKLSRKWELGITGFFLFLAFFQAWRAQYERAQSETAILEPEITNYDSMSAEVPFPPHQPVMLRLYWSNLGSVPARNEDPWCKIYLVHSFDHDNQQSVIAQFKTEFAQLSRNRKQKTEQSLVVPDGRPLECLATGPVPTDDEYPQLSKRRGLGALVLGAVRFEDNQGKHERHTCELLDSIVPQDSEHIKIDTIDCDDYTGQIDLP